MLNLRRCLFISTHHNMTVQCSGTRHPTATATATAKDPCTQLPPQKSLVTEAEGTQGTEELRIKPAQEKMDESANAMLRIMPLIILL